MLIKKTREAIKASELLRDVASIRQDNGTGLALGGCRVRQLTPAEIRTLEQYGNSSSNWSLVRVADPFDPGRVRHNSFEGDVVLGPFTGRATVAQGTMLPTGVYDSALVSCAVGAEALVRGVRLLAHYVICERAILLDCGSIVSAPQARFGNGAGISVGPQARGRRIPVYAEIDIETAITIARPHGKESLVNEYAQAVAVYGSLAASHRGIIGRGAVITNAGRIERTYVGTGCRVDGAARIIDSTLLGDDEEHVRVGPCACVESSLLQWGVEIGPSAVVERSALMEHVHVGRHGKVADSLLGPQCVVAIGEVTSCLLGPFVSAQHQSLLISLLWPAGRGNVAHGANVGSNHTSRCADQECWPGEGMFFGLGVNVKFPCNFSRAPYCVVAPGITLAPQRVEYPFALIASPARELTGVPSGHNEIQPGWMLEQNLFAIERTELKHRGRHKARRTRMQLAVFRPATIELILAACRRLESVARPLPVYSERDIPGLGKNVLTEESRRRAIAVYRSTIARFALLGLWNQLAALEQDGALDAFPQILKVPGTQPRWEYQRSILAGELGLTDPLIGLRQLVPLLEEHARRVEQSRLKDHVLGCRIIDDYFEHHVAASDDELVRQTWEQARRDRAEVQRLIHTLEEARAALAQRIGDEMDEACLSLRPVSDGPQGLLYRLHKRIDS